MKISHFCNVHIKNLNFERKKTKENRSDGRKKNNLHAHGNFLRLILRWKERK
jgi:hypothetical protein